MKVFISWSGDLSRELAGELRNYLPMMLQHLEVFVSLHDLQSGTRWVIDLAKELEVTNFGILCLTPDNIENPWLLYEAGALTKLVEGKACGILFHNLRPENITGPLSQFQHRAFSPGGFKAILTELNRMTERPLEMQTIEGIFEKFWPDLYKK
jgi:hypothetical protein